MKRLIGWWRSRSTNEKLMYGLILALSIGILTRVEFVWKEIGAAFGSYFGG